MIPNWYDLINDGTNIENRLIHDSIPHKTMMSIAWSTEISATFQKLALPPSAGKN
jgi:hypothetical protein